jgi:ABC-type oligopeptide transport system substrate-binding subunit
MSTLALLGTCETGYGDADGGVNGVISASFEGVVKEAQAGNAYTVNIASSLTVSQFDDRSQVYISLKIDAK